MPARSTNREDYQSVPRPVAAMAKDFPAGFVIAPHSHPRAQLIYAADGVMRVISPLGAWVVPPMRAAWIPANVEHEVRMSGPVAMRTLYIEPKAAPAALEACAVIEVTPLLRALILRAVQEPIEYDESGAAGLVMSLILDELARAVTVPLRIPLPADARLAALFRSRWCQTSLKYAAAAELRACAVPLSPSAGCWKSHPLSSACAAAVGPATCSLSSVGTIWAAKSLRLSNCIACTSATEILRPPAVSDSIMFTMRWLR